MKRKDNIMNEKIILLYNNIILTTTLTPFSREICRV